MTQTKTPPRAEVPPRPDHAREPVPTWRNTSPRGNPQPDAGDVKRSMERMEAVLGR